jgi:hypothetical protein
METRVCFAATNYGPLWKPVVEGWLACVAHTQRRFYVETPGTREIAGGAVTDRMYTHSAENALAEAFLNAHPRLTHIFMTECDMILPHDAIIKLLEVDQPVVSGVYFLRKGRGQSCLYVKTYTTKDNPYVHSPVSLFPTDRPFMLDPKGHGGCPGLGCVLIRREVFERVPKPWFDLKENYYGSDMYFWTKVRDAGFDVWVNPAVQCGQIDYEVTSIHDYHKRLTEDKDFAASGYIIGSDGWSGAHRRAQAESGSGPDAETAGLAELRPAPGR